MVDASVLKEHLKNAKDWEKIETDLDGVFVVKIPGTKSRPEGRLMVEINPLNPSTGKPKKRKGLFIGDFETYLQFRESLEEDKLAELIKVLDQQVNPKKKSKKKKIKL